MDMTEGLSAHARNTWHTCSYRGLFLRGSPSAEHYLTATNWRPIWGFTHFKPMSLIADLIPNVRVKTPSLLTTFPIASISVVSDCDPMVWAYRARLSMEFSRQKYWSGLPFTTQGIFRTQGFNLVSLAPTGRFFATVPPGKCSFHVTVTQRLPCNKFQYKFLSRSEPCVYVYLKWLL